MSINHHYQEQLKVSLKKSEGAPLATFDDDGDIELSIPHPLIRNSSRCCSSKEICRLFSRFFFSQCGLFVVVFFYIIFGGLMFSMIESRYEHRQNEKIQMKYSKGIDNIRRIVNEEFNWMLNASFELRYALWRGMLSRLDQHDRSGWRVHVHHDRFDRLIELELRRMQAEQEKLLDKQDSRSEGFYNRRWTYSTAMLYSATVITTVGYGNIAPKSILGKLITCLYAIIGIPIMIMYLTNTGDLLAWIFIKYYSMAKRLLRCRDLESIQSHQNTMAHVPIGATLAVLLMYIAAGAFLFSHWEGWSYVDGAYFSFITFTTIGLGDLVPGKGTLTENKAGKTFFCVIYLLFGLVLTAMCFKLMQDDLFAIKQRLYHRLGLDKVEQTSNQ